VFFLIGLRTSGEAVTELRVQLRLFSGPIFKETVVIFYCRAVSGAIGTAPGAAVLNFPGETDSVGPGLLIVEDAQRPACCRGRASRFMNIRQR